METEERILENSNKNNHNTSHKLPEIIDEKNEDTRIQLSKNDENLIVEDNKEKKNPEENINKEGVKRNKTNDQTNKIENEKKSSINSINMKKTGYYSIQLASVKDSALINKEWNRLNKIYKNLSTVNYEYKKINLKDGKVFYRLLAGEFVSKESAKSFCKITLKKDVCLIRYYEK